MFVLWIFPEKIMNRLAFCGAVLISGLAYHLYNGVQPSMKFFP